MKFAFFLLIAIGTAFSQEKGGDEKGPKSGRGSKGERNHAELFFKHFDANEDDKVTREEFDAGRRVKELNLKVRDGLFQRLDKNEDGVIEKKEVRLPSGDSGRPHHQMRLILDTADTDEDGEITFEEFSKHPRFAQMDKERLKKFFVHMDRNSDGVVTQDDRPEPRPEGGRERFADFDLDKNGSLSFVEFEHLPQHIDTPKGELRGRFDHLDSNANGQIDEKEWKKGGPKKRSGSDKRRLKK